MPETCLDQFSLKGQQNFGFGAEIVKKSCFGSVLFLVDCDVASFCYSTDRNWAHAVSVDSWAEHLLPSVHSAQSFTPVSCYSGILGGPVTHVYLRVMLLHQAIAG